MVRPLGLANDLSAYLVARQNSKVPDSELERRRRGSLWCLARFCLHLDQFVDQRGGVWLLGNEEQAQLVADTTWYIGFHVPATEEDLSWLSFAAVEEPVPSLHRFNRKVDQDDTGRQILARWRAWLEACQCDDQAPSQSCEMHLVLGQCKRYMDIIDAEWNLIVEWFTGPPGKSLITPEQVAEMHRRWRPPAAD